MRANSEERVKAVLDVFKDKLIKRGISLKALEAGEPQPSGKEYAISPRSRGHQPGQREEGRQDHPRRGAEGRQGAGPGRRAAGVSSKSRDDLQAVIALLKGKDLDFALQFVNYR